MGDRLLPDQWGTLLAAAEKALERESEWLKQERRSKAFPLRVTYGPLQDDDEAPISLPPPRVVIEGGTDATREALRIRASTFARLLGYTGDDNWIKCFEYLSVKCTGFVGEQLV